MPSTFFWALSIDRLNLFPSIGVSSTIWFFIHSRSHSGAKRRNRSSSRERKNCEEPGSPCRPERPRSWLSIDRKSTRLNSSHVKISYAVFCLKKKNLENGKKHNLYHEEQTLVNNLVAFLHLLNS